MKTLQNWTAKRAGGRMTIYYADENGLPAKVVGVDTIQGRPGPGELPVATDKHGERYYLAVGLYGPGARL